jgi:hypothetical protein
MGNMNERLPSWATEAGEKLGVRNLVPWSFGEVHSECPECGGKDRYVIWESGNAWCRRCSRTAFWKKQRGSSEDFNRKKRAKSRSARTEFESKKADWLEYHQMALRTPDAMQQWAESGINDLAVRKWGLGYTPVCPTYRQSPSLTIPVYGGGHLLDIRHRLTKTTPLSGKYRSHVPGLALSVSLFNRDALRSKRCLIVEGEKKAIVLEEHGYATCGMYGSGASKELLAIAKRFPLSVIVALDPDVEDQALRLSSALVKTQAQVWLASVPGKPDDFINRYGADIMDEVLRQARRVKR